jgi:hypothetical protein
VPVRKGHDGIAREGKSSGGGPRWFGYTRIHANPEETGKRSASFAEDINPIEAQAWWDAAQRVLRGETRDFVAGQDRSLRARTPPTSGADGRRLSYRVR